MVGGPPAAEPAPKQQGPVVGDDVKTAVRTQEDAADKAMAAAGDAEKQQVDKAEQELIASLKFALGQQAAMPGMPPPDTASSVVTDLRKANIKLRIEPITDQNGKPVADNLLQVKDSYTDRVMALSRKLSEGKATAAEKKEVQSGAKYAARLNDIKMQLGNVSRATMSANSLAQTGAMTTLMRIAGMMKTRKQMEMPVNDADYTKIAGWMARQRRTEAVAGTSLAVLATYQGVLNEGGNPQALDELAKSALQAFPMDIKVSDQEAKDYVKNLNGNIAAVKTQYEAMMRKTWGDATYESRYKSGIDAMFAQADPSTVKTATQIANETQVKYQADLQKCGRGEAIDPGSMVSGPHCKQAREAVLAGKPIPQTLAGDSVASDSGNAGGGIAGAVGNLIGGAMSSIPALNVISASLEGLQAIAKGDPRGALKAAIGLVPGGSLLKQGLQTADKVLAIKDKVDTAIQTKGASLVPPPKPHKG